MITLKSVLVTILQFLDKGGVVGAVFLDC